MMHDAPLSARGVQTHGRNPDPLCYAVSVALPLAGVHWNAMYTLAAEALRSVVCPGCTSPRKEP